jgi:cytochrome c-type biogenesis protein CcmH/NrfG
MTGRITRAPALTLTGLCLVVLLFVNATAVHTSSEQVDSLLDVSKGHISKGNLSDALDTLSDALKLDRELAETYFLIGRAHLSNESALHRTAAERAFRRATELDPENVEYRLALAAITSEQDPLYDSVTKQGESAAESIGDSSAAAEAAFRVGYRALKNYGDLKYRWILGDDEFADEEIQTALRFLERRVKLNPRDIQAVGQLTSIRQ